MNVLTAHPNLKAEVLSQLPQPDQAQYLAQLDRIVGKVRRAVGSSGIQLNSDRAWSRAQSDIEEYCTTVSRPCIH